MRLTNQSPFTLRVTHGHDSENLSFVDLGYGEDVYIYVPQPGERPVNIQIVNEQAPEQPAPLVA